MESDDQPINKLGRDITNSIDYFRHEFRVTYAEVIGLLEMIKFSLLRESEEVDE